MTNLEIYNNVFFESFRVNSDQLHNLAYRSVSFWDSVGHMALIAAMEEAFNIMFETDDIIDFSSYETGKQILKKYDIEL